MKNELKCYKCYKCYNCLFVRDKQMISSYWECNFKRRWNFCSSYKYGKNCNDYIENFKNKYRKSLLKLARRLLKKNFDVMRFLLQIIYDIKVWFMELRI